MKENLSYYLCSNDKEWMDTWFTDYEEEYRTYTDIPDYPYEITLGVRSDGFFKPEFVAHRKAWSSVKEMLAFLEANEGRYTLCEEIPWFLDSDDYTATITLSELKERLIHSGDIAPEKVNIVTNKGYFAGSVMESMGPEFIQAALERKEITAWKEFLTPIDHVEYFKEFGKEVFPENLHTEYWSDEDGYNFTNMNWW